MKTVKYGDYEFCAGQRCAFKPAINMEYYYGIVVAISPDKLKVLSDYKHRFFAVPIEHVVPVLKWNRDDAGHSFEELVPTPLLPHETVGKEMIKLDVNILFSMWLYINTVIFDGKLRSPAITLVNSAEYLGMCYGNGVGGKEATLIEISKRSISSANVFGVLAHEMVHQYNFEIAFNDPKKRIALEQDGHGPLFSMWQAPIQSKIGVKIEQYADMNDINFNIDLKKSVRQTKKRHYYSIVEFPVSNNTLPLIFLSRYIDADDAMADYMTFQNYNFRQEFCELLLKRAVRPQTTKQGTVLQPLFEKLYKRDYPKDYQMKNTRIRFYGTTNSLISKMYKVSHSVGKSMDFNMNVEDLQIKATTFSPLTLKQYDALTEGDPIVAELSYDKVEKKWDMSVNYEDNVKKLKK